jgi:thymidylate synthase
MNDFDRTYDDLVQNILLDGDMVPGRNGVTRELFGVSVAFDLRLGFPVMSGRKLRPRGVFGELSAFLKGHTTVKGFQHEGCNYWNEFGDEAGSLGPIYGYQWINWDDGDDGTINQIQQLVHNLRTNPESRRHIVTCWQPADLNIMSLPPCFPMFQVRITPTGFMDICVTQRSLDVMIGFPSDIILFGTLMHLLCAEAGYVPGTLTFNIGSAHIYEDHALQAKQYLTTTRQVMYPQISTKRMTTQDFDPNEVTIFNWQPGPEIKFELFI